MSRAGISPRLGTMTSMTAVPAISWAMTLMKVPRELMIDAAIPVFGPYSCVMIPISVRQPECLHALEYISATIRQPIPPPKVNHHADMP